jgi:hypothetical protein
MDDSGLSATAGGSTLGAAVGDSTLGAAESEPVATAGGSTLPDFFTCTLGGRCDRLGFGIAGDVAMFALLRRGTSGVPDGRAVDAGAADTFGGALVEFGAALPVGGRGKLGRGGSLTAGEARPGGAVGVSDMTLPTFAPLLGVLPDSGASCGALLIV